MKIVLIGNYKLDGQESMDRFLNMLLNGFQNRDIEVEVLKPTVLFGLFFSSTKQGLAKWFGYMDKYIVFPCHLLIHRLKSNKNIVYHITDHSNAIYLPYLPKNTSSITCHDVLAIRGGLGYADAYCPATPFGKILQKWILKNLSNANNLAAVSNFTMNQLIELSDEEVIDLKNWQVIYNGFNAPFKPMNRERAASLISTTSLNPDNEFIFHIGSNLERKNRKLLIDLIVELKEKWKGNICFAGKPATNEIMEYAKTLGVENRVISISKPNHDVLVALYSNCTAFIFPSFSEGFGWPLIEAQACGSPSIASNLNPMPEVGEQGALYANPNSAVDFANAFLKLQDAELKNQLIKRGFENIKRFDSSIMIDKYLDFFKDNLQL
ncbi:glycosyltransferase family 4 protein [Zobellia uliginosa]|uniref:glycosyltransferase family 4 protein n=1 Tax=Zobellia uliginosa TaxID=143224 RepID=UPI001C0655CD|nr:glycosyltransferase family 1 protein [Zobellia uliginosa]MBU2948829.1 glycosyltransferase family 4 protein [Zobellia uliginosa]